MSIFPKVPTGIPGLDVLTGGGLPRNRATLITGKSGTAKSISSLQIACNLARSGLRPMIMAIEEPPEDLLTTGDALGFGTSDMVAANELKITDLTRPAEGPTFVAGDYDISGLLNRIETSAREFGAQALVLDSATALFSPRPGPERLRSYFFQLVHTLRRLQLTAVITAEAPGDYGPLTTLGIEDFVCDLVIVLRNLVDGERRRRSVEIHKYRRSAHYKGEYPCTITMKGLTVFPLDARERTDLPDHAERFSSGLQGLDEMNSGGWLRDSIILVRGPSGSGKTTLAGMYARAGARRGERVVYYGFEETRPMLMRNFAAVGLPMEEFVANRNLQVICRYPEATSPEDLLVDLRAGLNDFNPSLVVLDSISSIEHSTSQQGFRQFMVGLAALLREHGRSVLLTQTVTAAWDRESAPPYLSTIPDAIMLLEYELLPEELRRTVRVLKMRGSGHQSAARQLHIGAGGLRVEPLPAAAARR